MRQKIILIITVIIALIFGRWLISTIDKNSKGNHKKAGLIPAVTVETVQTRSITRHFEANARVTAKYRVDILARISGYLTKSYFKEGDYVKKGQILFEIEPQEYLNAANKAKGNLDNVKSQAEYYNKQKIRYKELVEHDYVAKAAYDNVYAQSQAFMGQVESAESAYRDALRNLSYTKVKSPVNGRVGIIDVTVGNYVSMNSKPLTTINSSEPMYITFPLNVRDYETLVRIDKEPNVDRDVDFIFSSGRKYKYKGLQDFHDNKVDETTGTITLRATFKNPDDELIQGDFGRVIIYSRLKDDIPVVPQQATQENQEGTYVYILDENKLPKMVYIKPIGETEDGFWIVPDGINAGDTVITSGMNGVISGKPVKIVKTAIDESVKPEKVSVLQKLVKKIKRFIKFK